MHRKEQKFYTNGYKNPRHRNRNRKSQYYKTSNQRIFEDSTPTDDLFASQDYNIKGRFGKFLSYPLTLFGNGGYTVINKRENKTEKSLKGYKEIRDEIRENFHRLETMKASRMERQMWYRQPRGMISGYGWTQPPVFTGIHQWPYSNRVWFG